MICVYNGERHKKLGFLDKMIKKVAAFFMLGLNSTMSVSCIYYLWFNVHHGQYREFGSRLSAVPEKFSIMYLDYQSDVFHCWMCQYISVAAIR